MCASSDYEYYEEEINSADAEEFLLDHSQNEQMSPETGSDDPPLQFDETDPSMFFSSSLLRTKQFFREKLGIKPHQLRTSSMLGLIIIPIKDLSLLRADTRSSRIFPHLVYFADKDPTGVTHLEWNVLSHQFDFASKSLKPTS